VPDDQAGRLVRSRIGMDRLRAAVRPPGQRPQRDHGHLELLAARYRHLRAFTPGVLAALPLAGSDAAAPLLNAVEVLRGLNATGKLRVPADAPASFVPTRWRGYLEHSRGDGYGAAHRHYWELGVLYALQAALRSGDVWVPGSRRFTDPAQLLLSAEQWVPRRSEFCAATGTEADPHRQIARLDRQLQAALAALEDTLAGTDGPARLDESGRLVVAPLAAEQIPHGTGELAAAAAALLPRVDLASLLIEVDSWTGFTAELTHAAGGGQGRRGPDDPELRRNLYATPTFGHAGEAFLTAHASTAAWAAGTSVKYRQTLTALTVQLVGTSAAASITALDTAAGAESLAAAFAAAFAHLAPATRARHLAALRSAVAWWRQVGWVAGDPTAGWARPKVAVDTTWALTRDQVDVLFRLEVSLREKTLWRLLYETAARASEILNLDVADLDLASKRGRVTGKGGDVEGVFWQTAAALLLPRLLASRRRGPVFLADRLPTRAVPTVDLCLDTGRARLSYRRAAEQFEQATRPLAGERGWTLHQLRHSALTHAAEDGTNTPMLLARSRHASIRSLERYARPGPDAVARHLAATDPGARRPR
jgi:integrase